MASKLLYRQIHPTFVSNNRVTSQAFTPGRDKRLSVYDGDMIAAENAWKHYVMVMELQSSGVMAVTEAECGSQNLPVIPDPIDCYQEHTVIDFNHLSRKTERMPQNLLHMMPTSEAGATVMLFPTNTSLFYQITARSHYQYTQTEQLTPQVRWGGPFKGGRCVIRS